MKVRITAIGAVLALVAATALIVSAAAPAKSEQDTFLAGVVSDVGRFNDKGFNQLSLKGCKSGAKKAKGTCRALESRATSDYLPNFTRLMRDGSDISIATGLPARGRHGDRREAVPDVEVRHRRLLGEGTRRSRTRRASRCSRTSSGLTFATNQNSYMIGCLAALMAKRDGGNMISAVGGIKIPTVDIFIAAYRAGARKCVKGTQTLIDYSQDFVDQAKCKELALNQIEQGSKVVFQVAGGCGLGALDAAKEQSVWGVGVDNDQAFLGRAHPDERGQAGRRRRSRRWSSPPRTARTRAARDLNFNLKNKGVAIGKINRRVPKAFITQDERDRRADPRRQDQAAEEGLSNERTGTCDEGGPTGPPSCFRPTQPRGAEWASCVRACSPSPPECFSRSRSPRRRRSTAAVDLRRALPWASPPARGTHLSRPSRSSHAAEATTTVASPTRTPFLAAASRTSAASTTRASTSSRSRGASARRQELGGRVPRLESRSTSDYVPNFARADPRRRGLTVATGFLLAEATSTAAGRSRTQLRDRRLLRRGDPFAGAQTNVLGAHVRDEREQLRDRLPRGAHGGSRRAARRSAPSAAIKIPTVDIFIAAYKAGAEGVAGPGPRRWSTTPRTSSTRRSARSSRSTRSTAARKVVFQVAGGCGLGALDAAREQQVWGVGVDTDQAFLGRAHPHERGQARGRRRASRRSESRRNGRGVHRPASDLVFDLENERRRPIGEISPDVPQEFIDQMNELGDQIRAGEIEPPSTL